MVAGLSGLFAAVIVVMLLLIPVEKKHEYYQKWGKLAVLAETDERAKFAIDNAELYTEYWFNLLYDEDDFELAYNYPFLKDGYMNMTFTDEELNSEEVPAVYLDDPRWVYEDEYIKSQGCVAVAITMANLYLNHNSNADPIKIINYAVEIDKIDFGGIEQDGISDIIEHFGMTSEEHILDVENGERISESELKSAVDIDGTVLMVGLRGETFGSHVLIVRGYDNNGFYVNDPADPENTAVQWVFEVFENELVSYWVISN